MLVFLRVVLPSDKIFVGCKLLLCLLRVQCEVAARKFLGAVYFGDTGALQNGAVWDEIPSGPGYSICIFGGAGRGVRYMDVSLVCSQATCSLLVLTTGLRTFTGPPQIDHVLVRKYVK